MKALLDFANLWFPAWWITLMLLFTSIVGARLITHPKSFITGGWPYLRSRLQVLLLLLVSMIVIMIYYDGTVYDKTGTKQLHGLILWLGCFMVAGITMFVSTCRREGRAIYFISKMERILEKREFKLLKRADASKAERIDAWKSKLSDGLLIPAAIEKVKKNPAMTEAQVSDVFIRSLFCVDSHLDEIEKVTFACVLKVKQPQTETPRLYLTRVCIEDQSGKVVIKRIDFISRSSKASLRRSLI